MSIKDRKIKFELRMQLNHSMYIHVYGYIGITTTYIYMGIWVYIDA